MEGPQTALRIYLLGRFEVWAGDRVVIDSNWRRGRAQALVKLLALEPHHSIHREQVFERLWPQLTPEAAAKNLRQNLYILRLAFGELESTVHMTRESLVLSGDAWLDIDMFRDKARRALTMTGGDIDLCQAALALYAGDLLPNDLYEEWTEPHRHDLREVQKNLLLKVAQLYEQAGRQDESIQSLRLAIQADPALEEAHRGLMRLFAGSGQRDRALRQYQRCREELGRHLDAGPSAETQELYQKIANNDSADQPAARRAALDGGEEEPARPAKEPKPSRRRLPRLPHMRRTVLLGGTAVLALAVTIGAFACHHMLSRNVSAQYSETVHFSHAGSANEHIVVGDCATEKDMRTNASYQGGVSGDLSGTITATADGFFRGQQHCLQGTVTLSFVFTDAKGNQLFFSEIATGTAQISASANGKIVVTVNSPGTADTVQGGTGIYRGATGSGSCTVHTTSELKPGDTNVPSLWQYDCSMHIQAPGLVRG